ncbi:MAG: ABC transporter ATP-binding protein [Burkholderiaceae bacterium]|nr:ABC transporter ATP-binding protein [Burkholderiaceae bacterium]
MLASAQATASSTWERVSDLDAWRGPAYWRIVASPYTYHWRYSPEHKDVYALGMERQYTDRWLLGGAFFTNSFGQPSAYAYIGQRYDNLLDQPPLFFQWSFGILYGYTGKYASKVPMNVQGFSPGALVGLGWQFDRNASVAFHLLGDAGVMLQFAYDLR